MSFTVIHLLICMAVVLESVQSAIVSDVEDNISGKHSYK